VKIVFDCRSVFAGMGGIGRATAALARFLPAALPEAELVYLHGARRPEAPLSTAKNVEDLVTDAAMIDPVFEQLLLPELLDDCQADLYHNPCFAVPVVAHPDMIRVATVHDVVFRRHPELVPEWLRTYLDSATQASCEVADALVTVSSFSAREIEALYPVSPLIEVIHNAVDARFFVDEGPEQPAAPPYLLYVGSLEEKKNVRHLLRGMAELCRRRPELPHVLLLVGAIQPGFDLEAAVAESGVPPERVHYLGHVPDSSLVELYHNASVFCYLSEYEGFGLPPVEAMAAGTPVVAADRASLPEATDGAALLVEPESPRQVATAIERLLDDRELRAECVALGRDVAESWSWASAAKRLAHLYHELLATRRQGVRS